MGTNTFFGQISKQKLDLLQKEEDYSKCYELYNQSNLDKENHSLREIKLILYKTLANYLLYDPEAKEPISYASINPDRSIFNAISKNDPDYENKMSAILIVLFYCIKNRSFNYALVDNASHDEISQGEYLREWLEDNAETIIAGSDQIRNLLCAVMTLLYDKVLSATVELVHSGKDVPSSITTYGIGGSFAFSEINYRNTTKLQKINALKLKCMDKYRAEYTERRDYWKQNVNSSTFCSNKNTFLFGTYNLKELNTFLSQFDFKLYDISTKYYENYFCSFPNPFSISIAQIKRIVYLITDNEQKQKQLNKKHRQWPVSLLIKSFFKVLFTAILFAIPAMLIFSPILGENSGIAAILAACVTFTPPFNRALESKKRAKFSLL